MHTAPNAPRPVIDCNASQSEMDRAAVREVLRPLALEVAVKTAAAQVLKAETDAWAQAYLDKNVCVSQYDGKRITKPSATWTMLDEQHTAYHAVRNDYMRSHYGMQDGYCPTATAETEQRAAQRRLLYAAYGEEVADRFYCSQLDKLAEAIELTMGLALAA